MYVRETRQKRADGSTLTHVQLAESVWDPIKKRSVTKVIAGFGRADDPETLAKLKRLAKSIVRRTDPEALGAEPGWQLRDAWSFGPAYVLDTLWAELGLRDVFRGIARKRELSYDLERAVFAMVANRACSPMSKLYCYEQWLREEVRIDGTRALELHHLYRAMDVVEAETAYIEEALYNRLANLLNLDVELIFYDTTSLHFEIDDPDEDGEALRQRGHSKNGRGDAPQVVIGLAVTRDGFPIRHWVFPGNTVDVSTVAQVKEDLRGWRLSRCVFVGDAGMVSKANLKTLSLGGGRYIVGMPMRRGDQVSTEVMGRAGRYKTVAPNLDIKEVVVGEGERRQRYVVCRNQEEAARQQRRRQKHLEQLEAELASLADLGKAAHNKRVCSLVSSRRYGRYLRKTRGGKPKLDKAAIREAERFDGKFVVTSNDDSLTPEDLALGYKQLLRVEDAWRTMKSGLKMRPVYHHAERRIRAHIALTVWALLLQRVAESRCEDTWRNIRADLGQIKLAQLTTPDGDVWQVTTPREAARKRLKNLGIRNPPLVVQPPS